MYTIAGKARQRICMLFKCSAVRNILLLMKAYVSYVVLIFGYCSSVWSPCQLSDIDLLESMQRTFTKRLHSLTELPYEERLYRCGPVSLELRRLRMDLALCYQVANGLIAPDFKELFLLCNFFAVIHPYRKKSIFLRQGLSLSGMLCLQNVILSDSYSKFDSKIQTIDLSMLVKRSWDNSLLLD